jgi:hypothetical protein
MRGHCTIRPQRWTGKSTTPSSESDETVDWDIEKGEKEKRKKKKRDRKKAVRRWKST